ncbi:MAG: hypothetical protein ACKVOE_06090 [Rickettsiales bacterium]
MAESPLELGPSRGRGPSPEAADDVLRQQLIAKLDNILNDLRDPDLIAQVKAARSNLDSGIMPAGGWGVLIAQAQVALGKAESKVADETAERTREAIYAAIALSAQAQARVESNLTAIRSGNAGQLYRNEFGPMDEETFRFISKELANDPIVQKNMAAVRDTPESATRPVLEEKEQCRELVDELIAKASAGPEANAKMAGYLKQIKDKRLFMLPDVQDALKEGNLTTDQLEKLVADGMKTRTQLAQQTGAQFGRDTYEGRMARQYFGTADGYDIDYTKLLDAAYSPEGIQARAAWAHARGDMAKVPEKLRPYAVAAEIAFHADANYLAQSTMFGVMHKIATSKERGEVGHEDHFAKINDRDRSPAERLQLLEQEMREHNPDFEKMPQKKLHALAQDYLAQINLLKPEEAERLLMGNNRGEWVEATRESSMKLREANLKTTLEEHYGREAVDKLLGTVNGNPSGMIQIEAAARGLRFSGKASSEIDTAVRVANNPAFADSLSKIRYYNLTDTLEGQRLINGILHGNVDAAAALTQVEALRQQTVASMQPDSANVTSMLSEDYKDRLARISTDLPDGKKLLRADGTLDAEQVIEQARIRRDKLGATDEAIKAIAKLDWKDLTEDQRDQRVLARAAIRFKAIEAVQQFGERLGQVADTVGEAGTLSAAALADKELFKQIHDSSNPEARLQALDKVLQSLQYLRVNEKLRTEVAGDMVELLARNPNVFKGADTREQAFDTKIELDAREQQGSTGLFDDLSKSNLEKAIIGAVQNLSPETRRQIFSSLMGSYNEADPSFISYNEIENALRGGADKSKSADAVLAAIDTDHSGQLSVQEIANFLKAKNVSAGQPVEGSPQKSGVPLSSTAKTADIPASSR